MSVLVSRRKQWTYIGPVGQAEVVSCGKDVWRGYDISMYAGSVILEDSPVKRSVIVVLYPRVLTIDGKKLAIDP